MSRGKSAMQNEFFRDSNSVDAYPLRRSDLETRERRRFSLAVLTIGFGVFLVAELFSSSLLSGAGRELYNTLLHLPKALF